MASEAAPWVRYHVTLAPYRGNHKTALRVAPSARYNVGWRHYTQRDVRCAHSALGYMVNCAFSAFLSNMHGCLHLTTNGICRDVARRVSTLRASHTITQRRHSRLPCGIFHFLCWRHCTRRPLRAAVLMAGVDVPLHFFIIA